MGSYDTGKAIEVPLNDFAPDLDPTTKGITLDMANAMPTLKGYQALNSPVPVVTSALTETPLGSTIGFYSDNSTQYWAGGKNHLWRRFGSIWIQVDTLGAGSFGATAWDFAQFNDDLIAVGGGSVAPQVATGSISTFGTLGGSPPSGASLVLAVNSQVMMFKGNTWYVSAIGSDSSWNASTQTQAGNAPITDIPGNIVCAVPFYRNVVAFKNQGIWFGSYVGGASIWSFQFISTFNGTWGPNCAAALPDMVAFLGLDDFYYTTGYTPIRIPNNLKEWFFDTADPTQLAQTQARYDPYHSVVYWSFVSKVAPVAGQCDQYVCWNERAQKWGRGYLQVTSLPDPNTQPGLIRGAYFDQNNILQSYTGFPGTMRIRTGWQGMPGKITQLMRVRGKYNIYPNSETLQAYHVYYLGQLSTKGPAGVRGADDWFYLRQTDRYHQVEIDTVGSVVGPVTNLDNGAEITALAYEFREAGDR